MNKDLFSSCISARFFPRTNNYSAKIFAKCCAQVLLLADVNSACADGSTHLCLVPPNGTVVGVGAKLWPSIKTFPLYFFANLGVHYPDTDVGEKIAMASSTMISGQNLRSFIRLTRPDGSLVAAYTPSGITSDQIQ